MTIIVRDQEDYPTFRGNRDLRPLSTPPCYEVGEGWDLGGRGVPIGYPGTFRETTYSFLKGLPFLFDSFRFILQGPLNLEETVCVPFYVDLRPTSVFTTAGPSPHKRFFVCFGIEVPGRECTGTLLLIFTQVHKHRKTS